MDAALEERIIQTIVDWAPDEGPIDWEDMLNRVERYCDVDLPDQMDNPIIKRIQRLGRAAVREARC